MKPFFFVAKNCCCLLITLFAGLFSAAQDPVYSQAFLSPLYLNPAATGAGEHDLRLSALYRRQWWLIPSNFHSMAFSADKHLTNLNSGVGLLLTRSSAGHLNRNGAYGTFAYAICAGTSSVAANGGEPKWFFTGGLQAGVAQTRIDYSKLVFADQINTNGVITPSVSAANPPANNGRVYPDFAAGFFFNYDSRLLLGFSAHHINRPDESLTSGTVSPVPVKWTGNLMLNLYASDIWLLNFSGIGYRQSVHNRYQFGLEATNNHFAGISVGLYYGGSFNKSDVNTIGVAISLNLLGHDNQSPEKLRVGLGHDAYVGNQGYMRTGGSTELGMIWDYDTGSSGSPCKPKITPWTCPEFNR